MSNNFQHSEQNGSDDIKFEEVFDIDTIQKKLQETLAQSDFNLDENSNPDSLEMSNEKEEESGNKTVEIPEVQPEINPNAKKYVIYIDPENTDFIDGLSLNERREVINEILKEQNIKTKRQIQLEKRKKFFKHAILSCFTFIIFFPLTFILVNKSTESIILNYKQSEQNFIKIYRKQGKVKMKVPVAMNPFN